MVMSLARLMVPIERESEYRLTHGDGFVSVGEKR